MQINLGNLKVNTVDRSIVNIGPSVKTGIRSRARINQGQGEVIGDDNVLTEQFHLVDDRDIIDHPYKKEVLR
ncbi:MAG: hypothetical protein WCC10_04840 [Tumebacillaceae bacterium]